MAILTTLHHVLKAQRFYEETGKYMVIGRTTAWADENNPPEEDPDTEALDEVVAYAPVTTEKYYLRDDINGTFEWPAGSGQKWTEVQPANILTEKPTHVFVSADFERDDAPLVTYRQAGFHTGLVLAPGAPAGEEVVPAQVSDPGTLEAYDNRPPSTRYIDKVDTISLMFAF